MSMRCSLALVGLAVASGHASGQYYNLTSDVQTDLSSAVILDITNDGVGIGYANNLSGQRVPMIWDAVNGMRELDPVGGPAPTGEARQISSDGQFVMGVGDAGSGSGIFVWNAATGFDFIDNTPDIDAFGMSDDGSTVVGQVNTSGTEPEAAIWTGGAGPTLLGDFRGGGFDSAASVISADGSVIAGVSEGRGGPEAFRWTQAGGMESIQLQSVGIRESFATAISSDGSVIAGYVEDQSVFDKAFWWTEATGMQFLDEYSHSHSYTLTTGISGDGSVLVGNTYGDDSFPQFTGWIWTEQDGYRSVKQILQQSYGITPPAGARYTIYNVSPDGKTVVGSAGFFEGGLNGFTLTLPNPCPADVNGDGAVTPTDFSAWIDAYNNNEPGCDQNLDGDCTPTDFSAWIANFNDGC